MAPKKEYKAKLYLLGTFDDDKSFNSIIEDPYYVSLLRCLKINLFKDPYFAILFDKNLVV